MGGPSLSAQPRRIYQRGGVARYTTVNAAGQWILATNVQGKTVSAYDGAILLVPADLAIYDKASLLELQVQVLAGNVGAAMNWYASLYAVAPPTGLSGAEVFVLGAEVPESRTPTFASPAGGGDSGIVTSSSFPVPAAAGLYALVMTASAAMAATSQALVIGALSALAR